MHYITLHTGRRKVVLKLLFNNPHNLFFRTTFKYIHTTTNNQPTNKLLYSTLLSIDQSINMVRTTNRYDRINAASVSFDEDDDNNNNNDYDNDDELMYSTFDEYVADFDALLSSSSSSSSDEDSVIVITEELDDDQEELLDIDDDTSADIDVITEELGQELLDVLTDLSNDDNSNNNSVSLQVSDIIHEYDESDIELMKEGLSLLIEDDDDNEEMIDENDDEDDDDDDDEDFITGFIGTATPAMSTTTGLYPSLVPQVTFDEEDDDVTTPSTPSPWLNGQLTSYYTTASSSRGITYTSSSSSNNDKANKATRHQHWTQQEDEQLKIEVKKIQQGSSSSARNNIDWKIISYSLPSRSAIQCKCRWNKYLQPTKHYGKWEKYEDECILTMKREGFMWADIANRLERRTGDYIRDRYVNYLDPNIKTTYWTEEEDQILFKTQRVLGNKWSEIQKILPGPGIRPQNSIKNRYNNRVKAQNRRLKVKLAFKLN